MRAALDVSSGLDGKARIVRPDARFMLARLSRCIAFGLGSGLSPVAPGTVGTLWAWAVFAIGSLWITPLAWLAIALVSGLVGIWASGRTARDMGVEDHGAIVWDEIAAFWLVLSVLPATPGWHLAGFVVFRLFDIVKPPPIRWIDRNFGGGFGVMADDFAAAFATLLVLALWQH